ncbi:glycosyltransferase involved in cell wall biosynthesis [Nakamurella sp. UYEF19]|uniref:glycosyltransferase n=1 Tax=Nakamurella sp. UYEF19 TaxID=1756392 RepID=UPI00339A430D
MARREQLIFLHSSDELYGADRMLLEMVAAAGSELDVEVWLPNDLAHPAAPLCEELTARGVSVRHLALPVMRRAYQNPRGLARLAVKSVKLVAELRRARPQAVYCTTSAVLLAAPVARLARVPRVIGHIQEIWSRSDRAVIGTPARACHTVLSISEAVSASLPDGLRGRTVVVPNGTGEPAETVPLDGRSGELTFLVASRWNAWKGHRTLLAAWELAGAPGRLLVLGGPPPSGETVDVRSLVADLERPGSVTIVGEVTDPARYLAEADVVIMPSDQPEPFGLVAIEAFARGRPVIASAAGGLLDIVTEDENGWLYPPGDSAALSVILQGLDRDHVATAGSIARKTYEERFTTTRFAATWWSAVVRGWNRRSPTT